jgi:hypothetical protein
MARLGNSWQNWLERTKRSFPDGVPHKMQHSLDMLVKIAALLNMEPRQFINGGNND